MKTLVKKRKDHEIEQSKQAAIIATPVSEWTEEEEDYMRTTAGPYWLSTWKESSYEQKMSKKDLELTDSKTDIDIAEAMRTRRFLRRALYFKRNPAMRAMAENESISSIFRSDEETLESLKDAASRLRDITLQEGMDPAEQVLRYREIVTDVYARTKDANGNVRGIDAALSLIHI